MVWSVRRLRELGVLCTAVLISMAGAMAAEPQEAPIGWGHDVGRLLKSSAVESEAAVSKPKMVHRPAQTISAFLDCVRKTAQRDEEEGAEEGTRRAPFELDHAARKGKVRAEALAPLYKVDRRRSPEARHRASTCQEAAGSGSLPAATRAST